MSESSVLPAPSSAPSGEVKSSEPSPAAASPVKRRYGRLAWRITARYLVLALVYKFGTDYVVWRLAPGRALLTELVACKGSFFIVCTAVWLYLVLRREKESGGDATDARWQAERTILEQRAAYFSLVEQMPCGILQFDREGKLTFINAWLRELLGDNLSPDLMPAASCELIPDEVMDSGAEFLRAIHLHHGVEGERCPLPGPTGVSVVVAPYDLPNGTKRWLEITTGPRYDNKGAITGSHGVVLDITARVDAEAKQRASEEILTLATQVGRVGHFVLDESSGIVHASKVLKELDRLGEVPDRNAAMIEATLPEDREAVIAAQVKGRDPKGNGRHDVDFRMRTPAGSVKWFRVQAQTWFEGEGDARRPSRTIGVVREITHRKTVEAELRANEERYHSLFENMMNGMALCEIVLDAASNAIDYRYLAVNKAFNRLTNRGKVVGRLVSEILPEFVVADREILHRFAEVARTGVGQRFECWVHSTKEWYSMSVYRPGPGQFVVVFDIITEMKRSEDGMRTLSRAMEQSPASIIITNHEGLIQYVNSRCTEVSGYSLPDLLNQNLRLSVSGGAVTGLEEHVWQTLRRAGEWRGEVSSRRKDGKSFLEQVSISQIQDEKGTVTHYVAVKEDVTERRQLQLQTQRAQRLESVGQLASGIAHDLNNILQPIIITTEMLREPPEQRSQYEEYVSVIDTCAHRASKIINQLLTFGRGASGTRKPLDVGAVLQETETIIKETFPRELELSTNIANKLDFVLADKTQLAQVFLNLCVNARDAMPNGGRLVLAARNHEVDANQAARTPLSKPGHYVLISVSDTGIGMTPEVQERMFDPFFTTKDEGKGTGLGLSMVLGIVRSYGGFIDLCSAPGQGARFEIYLPAHRTDPTLTAPAPRPTISAGQGQTILLVDDELHLINAFSIFFEAHGYQTLQAANALEAISLFRLHGHRISLVFTDIMMPGMNGLNLIRELRKMRADTRFVVVTGLDPRSKQRELAELGLTAALQKPCSSYDALAAVQEALTA